MLCVPSARHLFGTASLASSALSASAELLVIEATGDGSGGDNWSSCNAPVKSSPPTNQHPTCYKPDALPVAQPTVSKHWTIDIFKNRLDKFRKNQDMMYDYKCDLTEIDNRSLTTMDKSLTYWTLFFVVIWSASRHRLRPYSVLLCLTALPAQLGTISCHGRLKYIV